MFFFLPFEMKYLCLFQSNPYAKRFINSSKQTDYASTLQRFMLRAKFILNLLYLLVLLLLLFHSTLLNPSDMFKVGKYKQTTLTMSLCGENWNWGEREAAQ